MENNQKEFTLFERLMVVAIILFVAAVAIQNVLHSLKVSEEQTVHKAAVEYSSLRNMYSEQNRAVPFGGVRMNSLGATGPYDHSIR